MKGYRVYFVKYFLLAFNICLRRFYGSTLHTFAVPFAYLARPTVSGGGFSKDRPDGTLASMGFPGRDETVPGVWKSERSCPAGFERQHSPAHKSTGV